MKKNIVTITFIILSVLTIKAQQKKYSLDYMNLKITNTKSASWFLDTIYGYTGQSTTWFCDYFESVKSRNTDNLQLIIESQARNLNESSWYNTYSLTNTYYENDSIDEQLWKEWNTNTNNWNSQISIYNKFQDNGKILESFNRAWDNEYQEFYQGTMELYTYDNSGYLISVLNKDWDYSTQNWVNWSTITYTNDSEGNVLTKIEVFSNGNNYLKNEYTYDASGRLTSELEYLWYDNIWNFYSRTTKTYTTDNKISTSLYELYDGSWYDYTLITYSYNPDGLLQQKEEHNYENASYSTLETYTYNEFGNETSFFLADWNGASWSVFYKVFDSYDANQNQTEFYSLVLNESNGWDNFQKEEYYWNNYSTSIENEPKSNIIVYPNPADNYLVVELPFSKSITEIKIFDFKGQLFNQLYTYENVAVIDTDELLSGIYIVKIKNNNITNSTKFIKN